MKKLMIGLVGAVALCASAQAEVESENIVGYDARTIVTDSSYDTYNMLSVPFGAMNGKGFSLNKNVSVKNGTAGSDMFESDQIQIWNAASGSYDIWYLYEGDDEYPYGWYLGSREDEWFDDFYPNGLPAGTAFWYLAKGSNTSAEIVFSGEVSSAETSVFNLLKGNYNMVSFPFPIPFSLNDNLTIDNGTAGADMFESDQIQVWNAESGSYDIWYLYEGDDEYPYGWYLGSREDEWFDDFYPKGLPVGTAFWYLAVGEGTATITFSK